jgi:hypothetical protein
MKVPLSVPVDIRAQSNNEPDALQPPLQWGGPFVGPANPERPYRPHPPSRAEYNREATISRVTMIWPEKSAFFGKGPHVSERFA